MVEPELSTPVESQRTIQTEPSQEVAGKVLPAPVEVENIKRQSINVETSLYSLELDSVDAKLDSFYLKNYKYNAVPHTSFKNIIWDTLFGGDDEGPQQPIDLDRLVNMVGDKSAENEVWKFTTDNQDRRAINYHSPVTNLRVQGVKKNLTLQTTLTSGLEIVKTFSFYPDSYLIDMDIRVINRTGTTKRIQPRLNFGAANEEILQEQRPQPKEGITFIEEDFETYDDDDYEKPLKISSAVWAGVMSTYFESVVKADSDFTLQGEFVPLNSKLKGRDVVVAKFEYIDDELSLNNGQEYQRRFQLFVGPKVQDDMDQFHRNLYESLDMGIFDFLAFPILGILRWLENKTGNWGIAIIFLTLIVRLALFPMAYKGMISMKRMSQLNPRIKVLREKYKKDKEKLNVEIMAFYKKNKVNPVGGCLPMLMQIPVFFALYSALLPAIELRHQPFMLWLDDLSAADFTLVLPLIMGATMFLQQHLTPTPTMDPNQARMMKWMPVMMIFFFLDMPAGLVLYWVISNVFTIFQQIAFNKIKQPEVAA